MAGQGGALVCFHVGSEPGAGQHLTHRAQVGLETGAVDDQGRGRQVDHLHRGQAIGAAARQGVLSAAMSLPWLGDACGLVDAFRAKEVSPLEAIDASIKAIEGSPLNAFSYTDFDKAREAALMANVTLPLVVFPSG